MLSAMINAKPVEVGTRHVYLSREIEEKKRGNEIKRIKELSRSGLSPAQIASEVDRSLWFIKKVLGGDLDQSKEVNADGLTAQDALNLERYKLIKQKANRGQSFASISKEMGFSAAWAGWLVKKIESQGKP